MRRLLVDAMSANCCVVIQSTAALHAHPPGPLAVSARPAARIRSSPGHALPRGSP